MLAAFLCLGGFFVVDLLWQRWRWPGLLLGGVLVTAAVMATQSRSGLIGLAAGAVAYLVLQRRLSQVIRVLGGLLAAGAVLLLVPGIAPAGFRDFLSQSFDQGTTANANVQYRQDLYHAAGAAMAHHPIWGYGWGSGKSVATNGLDAYFGSQADLASLPVSLGVERVRRSRGRRPVPAPRGGAADPASRRPGSTADRGRHRGLRGGDARRTRVAPTVVDAARRRAGLVDDAHLADPAGSGRGDRRARGGRGAGPPATGYWVSGGARTDDVAVRWSGG